MSCGRSTARPFQPKTKLGYKLVRQYMMGDVLGEGSQGKVREALHSETLRRVAIKIVNLRQIRKVCSAEASLRRELSIHRRLKHVHVVNLFEHFMLEEKQKVYVVLEHMPGGSLQDVADTVPGRVLPTRMSRRFLRQLFEGLDYCHSQGVIHRDIKPSNLLVSTEGILKIADFGVAEQLSLFDESDTCSKSRGSPAFQPPEVAAGLEHFSGFKVDVWAAGVSLYLVATGSVPFEGTSLVNLFANIEKGDFSIPPCIADDAPLLALIRGLLAADQAERHSVKEALRSSWLGTGDDGWTDEQRALMQSITHTNRSFAVLRSVARMYGEVLREDANPVPATFDTRPIPASIIEDGAVLGGLGDAADATDGLCRPLRPAPPAPAPRASRYDTSDCVLS